MGNGSWAVEVRERMIGQQFIGIVIYGRGMIFLYF